MRTSHQQRRTKETDVNIELNIDGGIVEIDTGIGFFDHMLNTFALHGGFGLKVLVKGDLNVDCHHTVEDTGIVLGKAFREALGDRSNIVRYGSFFVPMDEALAFAALDISGRPFLVFDAEFNEPKIGEYDSCLTGEFFRALAFNAGITLHVKDIGGKNAHHQTEALYKAVAHALKAAVKREGEAALSTKGVID